MIKEIIGYTTATTVLPKVDSGPNTNGHEYVDLGLPSGTLWATMNVGATSETGFGNHYQYGKGASTVQETYSQNSYTGAENPLDLSKDTARQVWGGDWRMPTKNEYSELLSNTIYQWVTDYQGSGVNGATFTAQNGNVLFIPAAGDYTNGQINGENTYALLWTSTPEYNASGAWYFYSKDSAKFTKDAMARRAGYSVRPVIG